MGDDLKTHLVDWSMVCSPFFFFLISNNFFERRRESSQNIGGNKKHKQQGIYCVLSYSV